MKEGLSACKRSEARQTFNNRVIVMVISSQRASIEFKRGVRG